MRNSFFESETKNMKQKYVPERMCMACRQRKPKKELLRFAQDRKDNNQVTVDSTGKMDGRGVYLCYDMNCLKNAQKAKRLNRAFSCQVDDSVYTMVEEAIRDL